MFGLASQSDLDVLDDFFNEFVEFIDGKRNQFNFNKTSNNSNINNLMSKWKNKTDELDKRVKSDMKVMGEVVITMDKVEQGIYSCRIHSNTNNPMITTLKNTINKMLETVNQDMNQLKNVVEQYSHEDYRSKIT
ncbi:MAG: hypothetical protein U9Q20_00695, partial [Campylobacterota bacterium]|nr:hypothetical protein [Campylobacterota bacterium]